MSNIDKKLHEKYNILINNVMSYCEILALRCNELEALQNDSSVEEYRFLALIWLKGVVKTFRLSSETRDTAIQILDNYFLKCLYDDPSTKTKHAISLAVVSSIILASKMHEAHNYLSMKNFTDFDLNELVPFQGIFLQKINFEIYVNATPTSCVHIFLGLWDGDKELKKTLTSTADIYIADFYCARMSMLFAPSTIAICALIISFSTLRMDCTPWLDCVPDICLRRTGNNTNNSLFDIDKCLDIFQRIERVHRRSKIQVESPTSIACTSSDDMDIVTNNRCASPSKFKCENPSPSIDIDKTGVYGLGTLDLASIEEDCSPRINLKLVVSNK